MAIYSGFTHWKWWVSIAMLNYQRVISMVNGMVSPLIEDHYPLVSSNMATENGPLIIISDVPMKPPIHRGCSIAMFDYQRVSWWCRCHSDLRRAEDEPVPTEFQAIHGTPTMPYPHKIGVWPSGGKVNSAITPSSINNSRNIYLGKGTDYI